MAEPMSRGFDQTCGTCNGNLTVMVEKAGSWDGKTMSTIIGEEVCRTCGGAGRIGGQSQ